jgi:hypothetical protein
MKKEHFLLLALLLFLGYGSFDWGRRKSYLRMGFTAGESYWSRQTQIMQNGETPSAELAERYGYVQSYRVVSVQTNVVPLLFPILVEGMVQRNGIWAVERLEYFDARLESPDSARRIVTQSDRPQAPANLEGAKSDFAASQVAVDR